MNRFKIMSYRLKQRCFPYLSIILLCQPFLWENMRVLCSWGCDITSFWEEHKIRVNIKVGYSLFDFLDCNLTFTEMKAFYRNVLVLLKKLLQAFLIYNWKFYPKRRGSHFQTCKHLSYKKKVDRVSSVTQETKPKVPMGLFTSFFPFWDDAPSLLLLSFDKKMVSCPALRGIIVR